MISTAIVSLTLLMAALFSLVYALNPAFRRKVEAPKHVFLRQLAQYDEAVQQLPGEASEHATLEAEPSRKEGHK